MLERRFGLARAGTTARRELIAGFTTFVTMSYIVAVNPAILQAAGIPIGPSMVATALTAAFGSLIMGVWANRPFAIAPYMGENAFVAYTVVKVLGYTWQNALAAGHQKEIHAGLWILCILPALFYVFYPYQ